MRSVWTILVAWLVATGGVGRAESAGEPRADLVARADAGDPGRHALATRAASHVAVHRARSGERRLPPAALPAAFTFRAPTLPARALPQLPPSRPVARLIATGSARGPPIA